MLRKDFIYFVTSISFVHFYFVFPCMVMNLYFRTSFSMKDEYRYLPKASTNNEEVGVIHKIKTTIM